MNPHTSPDSAENLPPAPERPDCCGGGCAVCVLDGYAEELELWQKQVAEILRLREKAIPRSSGHR